MDDLRRELAPISDAAWGEIADEARRTLETCLAARKLVGFVGPLGWAASAVGTGRVDRLEQQPGEGSELRLRETLPLVELRCVFELSRQELDAVDRGAKDAELQPLVTAARNLARAEDLVVFQGLPEAGIRGITSHSAHDPIEISPDYVQYPHRIASATERLRTQGVGGPYALALGSRCYTGLAETTGPGGYPVIQHVRRLVDGPVAWAPALDGVAVLSLRGGDFELTVGRDVSIGYLDHAPTTVRLYLEESLTFRLLTPEAAVALTYPD